MQKVSYLLFVIVFLSVNAFSQEFSDSSRTELKDDAGAQGSKSGFFQTASPVNYPAGASGWWHLLDVRNSNSANNYAMQFAGSFYDGNLYFRKTNNNPSQPWSRVLLETNGSVGIGGSATDIFSVKSIIGSNTEEVRFGGYNGRTLSAYENGQLFNFDFYAKQTFFSSDFVLDRDKAMTFNYLNKAGIATNASLLTNSDGFNFFIGGDTRMLLHPSGHVGIGTTNPATQLHLYNNSTTLNPSNFITIENRGANTTYSTYHPIGGLLFAGYNSNQPSSNVAAIWVERIAESNNNSSSGEIVFGVTKTPSNILTDNKLPDDVMRITSYGGLYLNSNLKNTDQGRPLQSDDVTSEIRGRSKDAFWMDDGFLRLSAGGGTAAGTKSYIDLSGYTTDGNSDRYQNITMGTSGIERLRIANNGAVGIGTKNPTEMLSVAGTVLAQKVRVVAASDTTFWPDYVFQPSYNLRSLSSLEAYINQNKHLPDVPSVEEVEKDGLDIGSTQAVLLKKIEELSLYVIELNKKMEKLEKVNKN